MKKVRDMPIKSELIQMIQNRQTEYGLPMTEERILIRWSQKQLNSYHDQLYKDWIQGNLDLHR
jgi:hypothetical protein